MKRITKLLLGLMIIFSISSCELFNADVDTTISANLDIALEDNIRKSATDEMVFAFTASDTINPLDEPDIQEYADKIVDIGINGVVAEVESVSKDGVVFKSGTTFTISNDNHSVEYVLAEDWPIDVGMTINLENLDGFYNEMSEIFLELKVFTVSIAGSSSETNVEVTIQLDMETTISGSLF